MTIPVPGLVGASVFSSIQPLKTDPNPPSPSTLSGLKFLVAVLSSLKVKALTFAASRISSSLRGVGSIDAEDAWLLELLRAAPFLLANLEVAPDDGEKAPRDGLSELILAPQQFPMAKHGADGPPVETARRLPSGKRTGSDPESSEMEPRRKRELRGTGKPAGNSRWPDPPSH